MMGRIRILLYFACISITVNLVRCNELDGQCFKKEDCDENDGLTTGLKPAKYKLTYFNLNALAEPIRWTFKVAGIPFEDERIENSDWKHLKESGRFPGKQMPLLEIDGTVYTQSSSILRYLGRKFGLAGNDDECNLRIDQAVDIVTDGRLSFLRFLNEADADKKEEIRKDLISNVFPVVLKQLEDIVSSTDGDFIRGSKLTWGDLVMVHWFQIWEKLIDSKLLETYPSLNNQKDTVLALPQIKAWIAERPTVPL